MNKGIETINEKELNIYKIVYYYSNDVDENSIFVETNINVDSFIKISGAISFIFEELVDESILMDVQHLAIVLENFFGVLNKTQDYQKYLPHTRLDLNEWDITNTFKISEMDKDIFITQIDWYTAREYCCGNDYKKLMEDYLPNTIEFENEIKNLRDFYPFMKKD